MTPVLGPAQISEYQARDYLHPKHGSLYPPVILDQIVTAYFNIGGQEGVRPEVALAQALKETGYFRYGGAVKPDQFNFAGIGATGGGVAGHSWPTIEDGVRGHVRRLLVYATQRSVVEQFELHDLGIMKRPLPEKYWGSAPNVEDLSGKWAPSPTYGQSLVADYLKWIMAHPDPSRPLAPDELVTIRKLLASKHL